MKLRALIAFCASVFPSCVAPALAGPPTMREFLGLCGHTVQFKPALYAPVCGWVRDYHPVDWDLSGDTSVLPAWPEAKNRVNWQEVYGSWRAAGLKTTASLMFENIPREKWKNLLPDLKAYGQSFAREFGPGGSRKLLEAVEVGNEPGKWSDETYSEVLRALTSGLRAGDPALRIATCNLTTGKSHDYAKSVTCLTGLESSYDILNIHVYPQLDGWPTWKRSWPEDPALKNWTNEVQELCRWRDAHAAGKPVWITEYGYDATTKSPDPKSEFAKWQGVSEKQQALWLVRSTLLFAAMPVERAAIYFFNDSDEAQLHGASGLTRNFQPKPAYHATAHLLATLGDYHFDTLVESKPGERIVQRYQHKTRPLEQCLVIWRPTGDEGHKTMTIDIPASGPVKMSRTPLTPEKTTQEFPASREVEVSGVPLFINYTRQM